MSVKLIAEIGSNWEGSIELAKRHISSAKNSGADFVKFQMWRAEDLYSKENPQWNSIKKSEITFDVAKELKDFSDKIGIKWFSSVFYPEAVDFLESIDVDMYKIASRTSALNDKFALETIQSVANTEKITFVSTGEGGDKDKLSRFFKNNKVKFTYCVSEYPTSDSKINWNEIFDYDFFSDHTLGITIPLTYVVGKKILDNNDVFIEKHTRFQDSTGPDSSFAITYEELNELNSHIKRIEKLNLIN